MDAPDLALEPAEIRAGRYLLRPPSPTGPTAEAEAADILAMAQDPEIRMWNALSSVTDEGTARAWCLRWSEWDQRTAPVWCIRDADHRVQGKLLGVISLFKIDMRNSSAETGYRIAPWDRGRGVATAALRTVADWTFQTLGLTRLQLIHGLENRASCRVAEKSGFALEGTLRSSYRYGDGNLHDEHIHARLATDPLPAAASASV
jgi:RimJ/RimL family protein N-acetyltransferase